MERNGDASRETARDLSASTLRGLSWSFRRSEVTVAPSVGVAITGVTRTVRSVRTSDHWLYAPPLLNDLTRHQYVVAESRSGEGV